MIIQAMPYPADAGGGGAGAFNNGDWYNAHFQVDANGKSDGTSYTTEDSEFGRSFTYQDNAQVSGGKFVFDGIGDYLECNLSNNMHWVAGSRFTVELRDVVFDTVGGGQALVGSFDSSTGKRCWLLQHNGTQLALTVSTDGTATTTAAYTWTPTTGVAYDITATWDGAKLRLYVDDTYVAGTAFSGELRELADQPLRIGATKNAGTTVSPLDGSIRAIRFTKGRARTVSESSITLPSLPFPTSQSLTDSDWPNVVLLVTYKDDISKIVDDSRYDWPMLKNNGIVGDAGVTLADGTPSIAFNGSNQYLSFYDAASMELGSAPFTMEVFARHDTLGGNQRYVSKYQAVGTGRSWAMGYLSSSNLQWARSSTGSSLATTFTAPHSPTVDTWNHVAYCRDGSNNGRFFVDGTQAGSTETDSITYYDNAIPVRIGVFDSGGLTQYMDGYLTEIRVTKAGRYSAGFTSSEEAFPRG